MGDPSRRTYCKMGHAGTARRAQGWCIFGAYSVRHSFTAPWVSICARWSSMPPKGMSCPRAQRCSPQVICTWLMLLEATIRNTRLQAIGSELGSSGTRHSKSDEKQCGGEQRRYILPFHREEAGLERHLMPHVIQWPWWQRTILWHNSTGWVADGSSGA